MNFTLQVRPQTIQNITTGSFPWYLGCHLRVRASGMIGSGVVCTGQTPPGGWGAWPVNESETNWPCRGGLARRYGLIGSINNGPWFFIGAEVTKFSTDPRGDIANPPPSGTLRLAVNRPHPDHTAAGDGEWTVQVQTFESMGRDPATCRAVQMEISALRTTNALTICEEVRRAGTALEERQHQMEIAFEVAGGLAIALTLVATAPLVAQAFAEHSAQRAGVEALRHTLLEALRHLSPIPIVGVISAAITALAAAGTARSATTAARSAASPAIANIVIAIIIAGLIIAMVAAFVTAIAMALSLLTLGADRDNALSRWNSIINAAQTLLAFSREVCEPPFDETLPTCTALGG